MRHRSATTRGILAAGATLLLLTASAGPVGAGSTELFTIAIDLDSNGGPEDFTGISPLVCADGTAFTDFHFGTGTPTSRANTFHLAKFIDCGTGTFWISINAGSNFVAGDGTTGGWTVVKGSGTGTLTGLAGGGNIVGRNSNDPVIDLVDHYFGVLRQ